ncbi:SusC/RagA family TonB-linked outer membrane protein [Pedobacter metabolipauper]|uniref:TonB-linked SusC/RagA family outer membrane protein n=1 Tax=Pedobacter metabolipauper TaxID=425513 RepID=A0A4R6SQZ3_9SPHI|nr:TonB-dependent receptor [Pedobacter metabolipauper]TDQ07342.1 TonB-linked SusC/RagA family outer membrane protein [Pedobacter metabolipauper]
MKKLYKNGVRRLPYLNHHLVLLLILLGLFYSAPAAAQEKASIRISGIVKDTTGVSIPGVSVVLSENKKVGTVTDSEGRFSIDVPAKSRIEFTSVGFVTQSIIADPLKLQVTVVMKSDDSSLTEVVVTAFGKKERKEAIVGSVTSINPQKLKIPSSNLTNALAGQIAGVVAYQRSGQPGLDNSAFFIRGVTTFGYKQDPLILVDNIELSANDLARLQVDDIASFSILKDASATALYGARGANGVILVTTKEGVEGNAKINVRFENSISQATQNLEIADPITFMKMYNEAITTRNPLGIPAFTQNDIYNREQTIANAPGSNKYVYPAVDWMDELFKNRTSNQRLNGSVSGGGKIARYYIATSYNLDNGILKVSPINNFNNNVKMENYQLRSNVNINVTPTTEVVLRLSGNFDEYNGPITADGSFASDLYSKALHTSPVLFPASYPYNADLGIDTHILFGNAPLGGSGNTPGYSNPYADLMKGYKTFSRSRMSAQLELNQQLDFVTKGLNFKGIFNTNRYSYFDLSRQYNPFFYNVSGYDRVTNTYSLNWINNQPGQANEYLNFIPGAKDIDTFLYLQGVLDYSKQLGDNHNIAATLIGTRQQRLYANGTDLQSSLPFRNLGVSGRTTYSYGQRYFLEFNFGYNGSERFAEKNRFGFFPTIGASWIVSREKFWDGGLSKVINKLKFRASHGLVGNDAIGAQRFFYLSEVNLAGGSPAYFGQNNSITRPGVSISNYANDAVTWETSRQTNLAVELTILNSVNIIAEAYKQHRYDILMARASVPTTMGLESGISANLGSADSRGLDLSADYSKTFSGGFWMSGRGNFTFSQNKYGDYEQPAYKEPWRILSGQKIGVRWGYIAERLFVDDAEAASSPSQLFGSGAIAPKGGDIKYRDMNNDGKISEADQVFLGLPSTPEIVYGMGLSMGHKNFDLSLFFQGVGRTSFFIDPSQVSPFLNNRQVLQAFANSHWTEENQDLYAKYPRLGISTTDLNNNLQTSSWWMRDGAFIRLKSIELGYTIPKNAAKKMFLANCRIYVSGLNPLTWSRFKDWDPELSSNGFSYPLQKVYNIGINVNL